jgi:hypothetical protein
MAGGAYTGAATFSFIDAIETFGTSQTYAGLLSHMMEVSVASRSVQPPRPPAAQLWRAWVHACCGCLCVWCCSCGVCLLPWVQGARRTHVQPALACAAPRLPSRMQALKKQGATQSGGAAGGLLGALPAGLGMLGSAFGGGAAGMAAGYLASFALGSASLGRQAPVLCCDKQIDVYSTPLSI